jgi:aspartate racemase
MGPEATVELMRRIIAATPANDDQDHIHLIVDSNPQIPSRIAHLIERTGPDPTPELVRIARTLERAGADVLAMPCNTAHAYAPAIRSAVSIPLLDMVMLTVERAAALGARRIGLLASSAVHNAAIYAGPLEHRNLAAVIPRRQDELMSLIRGVKRGETGPSARGRLAVIAAELAEGSDVCVIACSELSLMAADANGSGVPIIDSLDVLTSAILEFIKTPGIVA